MRKPFRKVLLALVLLSPGAPVAYAGASESPPPIVPEGTVGDAATDEGDGAANSEAESEAGGIAVSAIVGVGAVLIILASALFFLSRRKR